MGALILVKSVVTSMDFPGPGEGGRGIGGRGGRSCTEGGTLKSGPVGS